MVRKLLAGKKNPQRHRHTKRKIDQETNNKYIQCHKYNIRQLDMFNHIIGYLQKLWNESYYVSLARRHYHAQYNFFASSFHSFSSLITTTTFISLKSKRVQVRTTNLWPSRWAKIKRKKKKFTRKYSLNSTETTIFHKAKETTVVYLNNLSLFLSLFLARSLSLSQRRQICTFSKSNCNILLDHN